MSLCPVCNSTRSNSFTATLLRKYDVSYYQCSTCGLLQTEEPYWLEEAYSEAISVADTGLVQRNFSIAAKMAALSYFLFGPEEAYLDVAGGYGMLTRLMRDFGFDYYWSDKYCRNLLARGFEADKSATPFSALTAFEVLEHVSNPVAFLEQTMRDYGSHTLVFSTELYHGMPPARDWWYYTFGTGQHISFYQLKTLQRIAERLDLRLFSAHGIHMFTDKPISMFRFRLLTGRLAYLISLGLRLVMESKTLNDHRALIDSSVPFGELNK